MKLMRFLFMCFAPAKTYEGATSTKQVTFSEFEDAELNCSSTRIPEPSIQWYKGTEETRVPELQSHGVDIIPLAAQLNSDVTLPCRLENSANISVLWFSDKDGGLSSGPNVHKYHNQMSINKPAPDEWNLRIARVSASFADVYTCRTLSGDVITKIKLVVETPPKIDKGASSPTQVTFDEFEDAELNCKATGIPEPNIQWYRGTEETPIGVSGPKLIMRQIKRYATGLYLCRAENKHGKAEQLINVTVNFPPEAEVMESEVFVPGGVIVTMSCVVQGSPLYNAYWKDNNGKEVNESESKWKYIVDEQPAGDGIPAMFINLIIKKAILAKHNYGNYTCVAVGDGSEAEENVWLRPPEDKSVEDAIH